MGLLCCVCGFDVECCGLGIQKEDVGGAVYLESGYNIGRLKI